TAAPFIVYLKHGGDVFSNSARRRRTKKGKIVAKGSLRWCHIRCLLIHLRNRDLPP
ncbi:hypothetical protein A2U01_0092929, partial [Trifolium medium]|nr:hypothetical protein [Trifolium medium]